MEKKLYRNVNERVLGGVAAGLARYFDIDVTWVRILFILAVLFGLSGLFIYVILWIAIPEQPFSWNAQPHTDYKVKDTLTDAAAEPVIPAPVAPAKESNNKNIGGLILIFLGLFFLLREFDLVPYWFRIGKLWPLFLIIPGLVMLVNATKKSSNKTGNAEPTATDKTDSDENPSVH